MINKTKRGLTENCAMPVSRIYAPSFIPGVDYSDHQNYSRYWPAVMLTDTSFYRNRRYHTKEDTIETLNFEKMSDLLQGLYGLLVNF